MSAVTTFFSLNKNGCMAPATMYALASVGISDKPPSVKADHRKQKQKAMNRRIALAPIPEDEDKAGPKTLQAGN